MTKSSHLQLHTHTHTHTRTHTHSCNIQSSGNHQCSAVNPEMQAARKAAHKLNISVQFITLRPRSGLINATIILAKHCADLSCG